jgi:hypothetical protein
MAQVSPTTQIERFALITSFILRAVADRARRLDQRRRKGRPQLDYEPFVQNLVAMAAAAMAAPPDLDVKKGPYYGPSPDGPATGGRG